MQFYFAITVDVSFQASVSLKNSKFADEHHAQRARHGEAGLNNIIARTSHAT